MSLRVILPKKYKLGLKVSVEIKYDYACKTSIKPNILLSSIGLSFCVHYSNDATVVLNMT